MKKLLSFIFALCIMQTLLAQNPIECNTIAELKALETGTKCAYVGNGTTTYYYGEDGILMQDATGAILLRNAQLSISKTDAKIRPNMEITDVWGTYRKEGGSLLARIEMSNEDVDYTEIKNENATFTPQVVDFDAYVANLEQYKGVAVEFIEINIRRVGESLNNEFYSLTSDATLSVPFDNNIGVLPVKARVRGYLGRDGNSKNVFRIGSKDDLIPLSVNSIKDIKNIVTEYNEELTYDMLDTFAVSHVIKGAEKNIVYIQERDIFEPQHYDHGLKIEMPATIGGDIKRGDYILGLRGKFRPYSGNATAQVGATFYQAPDAELKVVGSGAECRALPKYIYTLTEDDMQNAYRYESTLIIYSGGTIVKNDNGTYSFVVENENGLGRKELRVVVSDNTDLETYLGKVCAVKGILDVANNYPENQFTIICRDKNDIIPGIIQFETIKDLIAAGEQGSVIYELKNPVLVSYVFAKTQNTPTFYFVVQDQTAGIIVDLGVDEMASIAAGDSISGLKGIYNNTRGLTTDFLAVNADLRKDIVVKSSGNIVNGIEVTFAEILADKKLYENRVVTVRGVKKGSVFHPGTDYMPQDAIEECFVQGTDTIYYTTGPNSGGFTFYDNMDITGVVDNKVIGEYYSIWPLSQEHIINLDEDNTAVDNIDVNAQIYASSQILYIETEIGANVRVFNLQGQCLYVNSNVNSLIEIKGITEKCVIVVVDSVAYKCVIK